MKTYNKNILETTKKVKDKTYSKAMYHANKATNPSPRVLRIGTMISGSVGFVLLIVGFIALLLNREKWGWSSLCSGMIVIAVNVINLIRNVSKRNN